MLNYLYALIYRQVIKDACYFSSDAVRSHGFTILIDMRGSAWAAIKPILKVLQEHFSSSVHQALVVKPDNFWQKQRTTIGAHKYKFEVSFTETVLYLKSKIRSRRYPTNIAFIVSGNCD